MVKGCLVTRLAEKEITLDDAGEWNFTTDFFNYEKERRKAFLLPQWGIWVTSWARYQLLSTVAEIEQNAVNRFGDVIYCDTDSIKLFHYDVHKSTIEKINNRIGEQMEEICSEYNLPFEHFNDLGQYDLEYTNAKMKTLGAKRYITTYADGSTTVTVAGLPKKSLLKYCEKNNLDIYDVFDDGMLMQVDVAMKNASCYNDEPHSDIISGVEMFEKSSICIYPISFEMKLDKVYKIMISNIERLGEKYEKRVY